MSAPLRADDPRNDVAALVREAAALATQWDEGAEDAHRVTKEIAAILARLRLLFVDREGRPDVGGRSSGYRDATAAVYRLADLDEDETRKLHNAVRWHLSRTVREMIRTELARGDEEEYRRICAQYRINPQSTAQRRRADAEGYTRVPMLRLPTSDPTTAVVKGVEHMRKVSALLDARGCGDLSPDDRNEVGRGIDEIQTKLKAIQAAMR